MRDFQGVEDKLFRKGMCVCVCITCTKLHSRVLQTKAYMLGPYVNPMHIIFLSKYKFI